MVADAVTVEPVSTAKFITESIAGVACIIARSGYTVEDGFEVNMPAEAAETLARLLLKSGRGWLRVVFALAVIVSAANVECDTE